MEGGFVMEQGDGMYLPPKAGASERKVASIAQVLDIPDLSLDDGLRRFVRGSLTGRACTLSGMDALVQVGDGGPCSSSSR